MLAHSWLQRWVSHSFTSAGRPAVVTVESPNSEMKTRLQAHLGCLL